MKSKLKLASTLLAISAWEVQPPALVAQQIYHGGPVDARQHGYEHGYREGYDFGRNNSQVSNREQDIVNQKLRAADRDYVPAFGPQEEYRQGYIEGFRSGMEDGRNGSRSRLEELFRTRDPNFNPDRNRRDDRVDAIYPQNHWSPDHIAADIGYRDGFNASLQDRRDGRGFQPRRHTAWRNALHGYDPSIGSQSPYKRAYRAAYEAGYRDGFGSR